MRISFLMRILVILIVLMIRKGEGVMQVYDFPNENNFLLSDITYYELNTKFALFMKRRYLG